MCDRGGRGEGGLAWLYSGLFFLLLLSCARHCFSCKKVSVAWLCGCGGDVDVDDDDEVFGGYQKSALLASETCVSDWFASLIFFWRRTPFISS